MTGNVVLQTSTGHCAGQVTPGACNKDGAEGTERNAGQVGETGKGGPERGEGKAQGNERREVGERFGPSPGDRTGVRQWNSIFQYSVSRIEVSIVV